MRAPANAPVVHGDKEKPELTRQYNEGYKVDLAEPHAGPGGCDEVNEVKLWTTTKSSSGALLEWPATSSGPLRAKDSEIHRCILFLSPGKGFCRFTISGERRARDRYFRMIDGV